MTATHALEGLGRLSPRPLAHRGSPGRVAVACSVASGVLAGGALTTVLILGDAHATSPISRVAEWFALGAGAGFVIGALIGLRCNRGGDRVGKPLRHVVLGAVWALLLANLAWVTALWMALSVPATRRSVPGGLVASTAGWILGGLMVTWALVEIVAGFRRLHPASLASGSGLPSERRSTPTGSTPRPRRSG